MFDKDGSGQVSIDEFLYSVRVSFLLSPVPVPDDDDANVAAAHEQVAAGGGHGGVPEARQVGGRGHHYRGGCHWVTITISLE